MSDIEFVNKSTVRLVQHIGSDDMVAHAAWVSNFGGDHKKRPTNYWDNDALKEWEENVSGLINFLYRERHMSPFEHGSFTFFIDTPIFVAREFMRHRTWSYNETSGRYKELNPRFYLIDSNRPLMQKGKIGKYSFDAGSDEQYGTVFAESQMSFQHSWNAYQNMLDKGVAKEVARNVLPVSTMTQFYATANPRNIMQFLSLRNDSPALYEIRQVAIAIEAAFAKAMPATYAAYKKYDWRDEKTELEMLRKKVAQFEAEETYKGNIGWNLPDTTFHSPGPDVDFAVDMTEDELEDYHGGIKRTYGARS
jgi:thymidylate synthase (FAD)